MMQRILCVLLLMSTACGVSAGNPGGRGKLVVSGVDTNADKPELENEKKVVWIDKRFPRGVRAGDKIHLYGEDLGEDGRVFVGDIEAKVRSWTSREVVVDAPNGIDAACTTVSMADVLLRTADGSVDVTDAVSNHIPIVAGKGDTWLPADDYPGARAQHVAVWTDKEMIVYGGGTNLGGRYNPSTDSWIAMSSVGTGDSTASGVKAVWTGHEMVVISSNPAAYNPQTDSWRPLNPTGRPKFEGWAQSAVWTGSEVIVWGQVPSCGSACPLGSRYSPSTDSFRSMKSFNGSVQHSAVWTGKEMIVWGGFDAERSSAYYTAYPASGGRYDPEADSWRTVSSSGAPSAFRTAAAAFWTGSRMIVWGGTLEDGGMYDPANDAWQPMSLTNAPANDGHSAVWTGADMLVWNGKTAGRYNPLKNVWSSLSLTGSPAPRTGHSAIWTGQEMIVWGGAGESSWNSKLYNNGGRYSPKLDRWVAVDNASDEPAGYSDMASVWSGSEMIVWGGSDRSNSSFHDRAVATGARYSPTENHWKPIAVAPQGRFRHSAVWNGTAMEIWGGSDKFTECDATGCYSTGGIVPGGLSYSPQTDTWVTLPSPNHMTSGTLKPHLFRNQTGVLIWGGERNGEDVTEGAIYNQIAGTWQAITEQGAPVARRSVTTLINDNLFVWGKVENDEGTQWISKGALYSPTSDSWKSVTTASAPTHTLNDETVVSVADKVVLIGLYNPNYDVSSARWETHVYDLQTDSWNTPNTNTLQVGYSESWPKAFSDGSRLIAVFQTGTWGSHSLAGAAYTLASSTWSQPATSCYSVLQNIPMEQTVWTGTTVLKWLPGSGVHSFKP